MLHPTLVLPDQAALAAWCARQGIAKLALFDSALTDRFRPESDVDALVWFLPGRTPDFFRLHHLELELRAMFGGRVVALLTPAGISHSIGYSAIDPDITWATVTARAPELLAVLDPVRRALGGEPPNR